METPTNAKIIVLDGNETITKEIEVMYNPRDFSVAATAQVGGDSGNVQFDKVTLDDFTIELFYDTYQQKSDVRLLTQEITSLVLPSVEGKEVKKPPVCLFSWGGFAYKGIISRVQQKFTMFLTTGIPVRSELTVTFKSVASQKQLEIFSGKEACRKLWTVKAGDRLDLIAFRALKDPLQWRKIATVNNIINPLSFPEGKDIGRVLVIPD